MSRISYLDDKTIPEESLSLVDKVRARRPEGKLLNLDKVLLYSEPVAAGWQNMFSRLRNDLGISAKLRELIILRIAILNNAGYEFEQHYPEAIKAGIELSQIDALKLDVVPPSEFAHEELAILDYTDAMTHQVQVADVVYNKLGEFFDSKQIVEITALVAGYNMVSRFLEAIQITTIGE